MPKGIGGCLRAMWTFLKRFSRLFFCHLLQDKEKGRFVAWLQTFIIVALLVIVAPIASVAQAFLKYYVTEWQGLLMESFVGLGDVVVNNTEIHPGIWQNTTDLIPSANDLSLNDSLWFENVGYIAVFNLGDSVCDLLLAGTGAGALSMELAGGFLAVILIYFWRGFLTRYLVKRFMRGRNYYEILRQYRRPHGTEGDDEEGDEDEDDFYVDNPDQRIAADVRDFAVNLALIFCILPQSLAQVIVNTVYMILRHGEWMLLVLLIWPVISILITLICSRPLDVAVFQKDEAEGDFRAAHTRIRQHAESMAFYAAEKTELGTLNRLYDRLYQTSRKVMCNYFGVGTWVWIARNAPTPAYIIVLMILYFCETGPFPQARTWFAERNDAEASGRIMGLFYLTLNTTIAFARLFALVGPFGIVLGTTRRIGEFIEACEELDTEYFKNSIATTRRRPSDSIVFEEVTVSAPDGKCLVEDLSFSISPGQSLLIKGISGSGKSSVLRVLAGLWKPASGRIRPIAEMEKRVCFMPQSPYVFEGTLRENVAYPRPSSDISEKELREVMQLAQIDHLLATVGEEESHEWSEELSLGEQQRLGFARILFHRPTFAILDEATSALDSENEKMCYRALLSRKISCISAAHRESLVTFHTHFLLLSPDDTGYLFRPIRDDDIPLYEYEWEMIDSASFSDEEQEQADGLVRKRNVPPKTGDVEMMDVSEIESVRVEVPRTERKCAFFPRFCRMCCKGIFMHPERKRESWCAFVWTTILAVVSPIPGVIVVVLSSEILEKIMEWDVGAAAGLSVVYFLCFVLTGVLYAASHFAAAMHGLETRTGVVKHLQDRYLRDRMWYEVNVLDDHVKNPDQRITQDADFLTSGMVEIPSRGWGYVYGATLRAVTGLALYMLFSFLPVTGQSYWFVPLVCVGLFAVIILVVILLMWVVSYYQYQQQKKEGYFRHSLGRLKDHAEQVAFYNGAPIEQARIRENFRSVLSNQAALTSIEAFNTTLIGFLQKVGLVLPYLILSLSYVSGANTLQGSTRDERRNTLQMYTLLIQNVFELLLDLVSAMNSIGQVVGNTGRVGGLIEHLDEIEEKKEQIVAEPVDEKTVSKSVSVSGLTVRPPKKGRVLFRNLAFEVNQGQDLLIKGRSGVGKSSLLRTIGGLWEISHGCGSTSSPQLLQEGLALEEGVAYALFLPQEPYMVSGSLRDQVFYPLTIEGNENDERILLILDEVNLQSVLATLGEEGLDAVRDWGAILSPGEQQRLSLARLVYHKPAFAFLDECASSLDSENEKNFYKCCKQHGITAISVGHRDSLFQYHDLLLGLDGKQGWSFQRKTGRVEYEVEYRVLGEGEKEDEEEDEEEEVVVEGDDEEVEGEDVSC